MACTLTPSTVTSGQPTILHSINTVPDEKYHAEIYDKDGKQVLEQIISTSDDNGEDLMHIETTGLEPGEYHIVASNYLHIWAEVLTVVDTNKTDFNVSVTPRTVMHGADTLYSIVGAEPESTVKISVGDVNETVTTDAYGCYSGSFNTKDLDLGKCTITATNDDDSKNATFNIAPSHANILYYSRSYYPGSFLMVGGEGFAPNSPIKCSVLDKNGEAVLEWVADQKTTHNGLLNNVAHQVPKRIEPAQYTLQCVDKKGTVARALITINENPSKQDIVFAATDTTIAQGGTLNVSAYIFVNKSVPVFGELYDEDKKTKVLDLNSAIADHYEAWDESVFAVCTENVDVEPGEYWARYFDKEDHEGWFPVTVTPASDD